MAHRSTDSDIESGLVSGDTLPVGFLFALDRVVMELLMGSEKNLSSREMEFARRQFNEVEKSTGPLTSHRLSQLVQSRYMSRVQPKQLEWLLIQLKGK